jgi:hypothetical protein
MNGYAEGRGFNYQNAMDSCPDRKTEQASKAGFVSVTFSSTQLPEVGAQVEIDMRQGGVGWHYTVTYSDTVD